MNKNTLIITGAAVLVLVAGAVGYYMYQKQTPQSKTTNNQTPTVTQTTSAAAPSDNIYLTKTSAKGSYLADFQGMTLYTYDNDTAGVSTCNAGCSSTWPAYTSGAVAQGIFPTNISVITRADGSKQFAWKNKPLYYYSGDTKAGDMNGDGVGGVWHIVSL